MAARVIRSGAIKHRSSEVNEAFKAVACNLVLSMKT
jgi:hypothetical protein